MSTPKTTAKRVPSVAITIEQAEYLVEALKSEIDCNLFGMHGSWKDTPEDVLRVWKYQRGDWMGLAANSPTPYRRSKKDAISAFRHTDNAARMLEQLLERMAA